jgi:hypothetical protein
MELRGLEHLRNLVWLRHARDRIETGDQTDQE